MFGCLPAKTPLTKSCSISTLGITETCGVLTANRVVWDAPLTITNCILKLEPRTKTLKRCNLRISIRQLAHASAGGYTRLGVITVDLAEYLGGNKITRSFLLEDSRLNSTLNITIHNEQVRGDVMFRWKTPNPVSTDVEGDETARTIRVEDTLALAIASSLTSSASSCFWSIQNRNKDLCGRRLRHHQDFPSNNQLCRQ
ncbi:hypothetical protein PC112_g4479 [Phytophthora cactorum]|nr:hypothetical protein PC112_g4479 [Phytophthora cactorum]